MALGKAHATHYVHAYTSTHVRPAGEYCCSEAFSQCHTYFWLIFCAQCTVDSYFLTGPRVMHNCTLTTHMLLPYHYCIDMLSSSHLVSHIPSHAASSPQLTGHMSSHHDVWNHCMLCIVSHVRLHSHVPTFSHERSRMLPHPASSWLYTVANCCHERTTQCHTPHITMPFTQSHADPHLQFYYYFILQKL